MARLLRLNLNQTNNSYVAGNPNPWFSGDLNGGGLGDIVYENTATRSIDISLASGLASFAYSYDEAGNLIDNGQD